MKEILNSGPNTMEIRTYKYIKKAQGTSKICLL